MQSDDAATDRRLIERWLPIAELSEESTRERRSMTALPPTYYLHVWWARRPLVASRAAILASLLPENADQDTFLKVLGILGDPIAAKLRIKKATRDGVKLGKAAYGYSRAFSNHLDSNSLNWLASHIGDRTRILDPTGGGGSIAFESVRMRLGTYSGDLNPVAVLIQLATVAWPTQFTSKLVEELDRLSSSFLPRVRRRLRDAFPAEPSIDTVPDGYLWARTINCPFCAGLVPLSPNWRLAPNGTGVRLKPTTSIGSGSRERKCDFEIVDSVSEQSPGTVARGNGTCPFPDCGRVIHGDEIKRQAQAGEMGEQLYAVVFKRRVARYLKSGKRGKDKWIRGYRSPRPDDDNSKNIEAKLAEKLPDWETLDYVPSEIYPPMYSDRVKAYGVEYWTDLFSPRQLFCHGTSVEIFREMLDTDRKAGNLDELRKAAYGYLAIALDAVLDYNSRSTMWIALREVVGHTFARHDFSFKWSYSEMAPLVNNAGYDWAIQKTKKCIKELVELIHPSPIAEDEIFKDEAQPAISITCKSGDSLDHIEDKSIDAVVIDPPYYDNVMYAELSDFFYVWLKRTAGHVYPELFRRNLTDKENEAVANPARFKGQKGARELAGNEYRQRMTSIFAECHRVLKNDGIMTLMFTHKATGAWDALTKGLIESGFSITASWPINTEATGSLHIQNKAAAKSTIFLACRPRSTHSDVEEITYWEDTERKVQDAVRKRISEFERAGISGVDLYLASFGPALAEFSRNWPLERGTPRKKPDKVGDDWNPFEVTPDDALDAARREVKRYRLEQLTHVHQDPNLDPITAFFVLAWDVFKAPTFPYDEALHLARAVGVDLDKQVIGRLVEKKSSNVTLMDSSRRVAKGSIGSIDGSRGMIDAIHHAAHFARSRTLSAAQEMLEDVELSQETRFHSALQAVLEVLPVSKAFTGVALDGDVAASGSDFEVLENLRRFAYAERVREPGQLGLWADYDV